MISLDEIRARCNAATPGPWRLPLYGPTVMDDSGTPILNVVGHGEQENADMRFITNARTDIPALLAYIKELTTQLAEAERKEISTIPCYVCGGEVIEFTVPNDIWNLVMRPDGKETDKEYLCIGCWHKALRSKLESLTTPLAEAKADYEAAVEDIPHECEYCQYADVHWNKGECATCDKNEVAGEMRADNWTYRGRKSDG